MAIRLKDPQPRNPKVQAVLDAPTPGGEAARWLAGLVRSALKDPTEDLYHRMPTWASGGDPAVLHVEVHARHANLGFSNGALLDDPDGLLAGSGKSYRFVRVEAPGAVPKAKLLRLLRHSARLAKEDPR